MNEAREIAEWYRAEGRSLPWRESQDPYQIWISEIILQQTRVAQGLDYFLRFVARFPTVEALAAAPLDDVLKHWEGLGYYSRARNLHHTAQVLVESYGGNFPETFVELGKLKGIGPYTSRAIASFAFGQKVGVVDGNVLRVVSRYLASFAPVDVPATKDQFQALLDQWIATVDPGDFNQGIMDLGAMVCTPRNPDCGRCPLSEGCQALAKGLDPHQFPVKAKKAVRGRKWFRFFLVRDGEGRLLIRQRPLKGLWAGLWEVPNLEVSEDAWADSPGEGFALLGEMKHIFTHFDMEIRVYAGSFFPAEGTDSDQFVEKDKLPIFAFSRAVLKIFEGFSDQNG